MCVHMYVGTYTLLVRAIASVWSFPLAPYRAVALAIINSNQWEAALRHHYEQMTPFRRMIRQMPGTYVHPYVGMTC